MSLYKYTKKTKLSRLQITDRLNSLTQEKNSSKKIEHVFEGEINQSGFRILPIFDYSPNQLLRPLIVGHFIGDTNCEVVIKFKLPIGHKIGLIFLIVVNLIFEISLITSPEPDGDFIFNKWIYPWVVILTMGIFWLYLHSKIKESKSILFFNLDYSSGI